MLSLTQLKKNIFPLFNIMKNTGHIFEVAYKGTVYDVHVQATKKRPKTTRAKKARREDIELHSIDISQCNLCGGLLVSGVCMNKDCPSNNTI